MRLYGINPVIERLRSNPSSIRKIYIQSGFKESGDIYKRAKKYAISVIVIQKSKMDKIGRNINTQGVMMDVDEYEYLQYSDLLNEALDKKRYLVFLDNLTDPQNLGAIIRSLACLGKFSVVLPTHNSASVTEAVLRVASGGENYVPVSKVANLNNAIRMAKEEGYRIIGAVVKDGEPLVKADLDFPLGVVIGSESQGIRDVILKQLDTKVTIPMSIHTMSFNVAHAAAILCYEIAMRKESHNEEIKPKIEN